MKNTGRKAGTNARKWRDELVGLKCAASALPALFSVAMEIDALDDVARGFGEKRDCVRLQAARRALADGLGDVMPHLEHLVSLARIEIGGPDPEWAVFTLLGGLGDLTSMLSATARRSGAKLGKPPSPARAAAGARTWQNRVTAERRAA